MGGGGTCVGPEIIYAIPVSRSSFCFYSVTLTYREGICETGPENPRLNISSALSRVKNMAFYANITNIFWADLEQCPTETVCDNN